MSYNSAYSYSVRDLHADAKSWYTRVLANGGTADNRTLRAVDEFCRGVNGSGTSSISAIRTYIKSLNLFCGGSILAADVPLIADSGSSVWTRSGTISHRNNGIGRGITGNGSTGYYDTGVPDSVFSGGGNGAIVAFLPSGWTLSLATLLGADGTTLGADNTTDIRYGVRNNWTWATTSPRPAGTWSAVGVPGTSAMAVLLAGVQQSSVGIAPGASTGRSIYVCARNNAGVAAEFTTVPIGAVAILDGTSDAIWRQGSPAYASILSTLDTAFRAFHAKMGW